MFLGVHQLNQAEQSLHPFQHARLRFAEGPAAVELNPSTVLTWRSFRLMQKNQFTTVGWITSIHWHPGEALQSQDRKSYYPIMFQNSSPSNNVTLVKSMAVRDWFWEPTAQFLFLLFPMPIISLAQTVEAAWSPSIIIGSRCLVFNLLMSKLKNVHHPSIDNHFGLSPILHWAA